MFGNEHSGNRGGPPFFGIFGNCQKLSKMVSRAAPGGGALGDTFLTPWTPADRIQAVGGGGRGGTPPGGHKPLSNLPSGFTGPPRSTMALVTLTRTN